MRVREREESPAGPPNSKPAHPRGPPKPNPSPIESPSLPLPPPPARSPCSRSSPSPPLALSSTHRRGIPIPQCRYLALNPHLSQCPLTCAARVSPGSIPFPLHSSPSSRQGVSSLVHTVLRVVAAGRLLLLPVAPPPWLHLHHHTRVTARATTKRASCTNVVALQRVLRCRREASPETALLGLCTAPPLRPAASSRLPSSSRTRAVPERLLLAASPVTEQELRLLDCWFGCRRCCPSPTSGLVQGSKPSLPSPLRAPLFVIVATPGPVLPLTTTIASSLLPTRGPCIASFRVIKTNKFAYMASTLND
nr:proline-rich protein 36-like [Aegilops tauschii subsp. strangulata]